MNIELNAEPSSTEPANGPTSWATYAANLAYDHPVETAAAVATAGIVALGASSLARRAIAAECWDLIAGKATSESAETALIKDTAFVRPSTTADIDSINQIYRRVGIPAWMGSGDTATVLESEQHGVIGVALLDRYKTAEIAVLPEYRNHSPMLLQSVLKDMQKQGGNWESYAENTTGGRVLWHLMYSDKINFIERQAWDGAPLNRPITRFVYNFK